MKTFKISGTVIVSCHTEVKANTEEEALIIAEKRETANFCCRPFTSSITESWHVDSDGEPFNLEVEDVEEIE
jgi:hypothetical protein